MLKREVHAARSFGLAVFAIRAAVAALLFWGWTMSTGCAAPTAAPIALSASGPVGWKEQVEEASWYWNVALHEYCGDVFDVRPRGGLRVNLYAKDSWPEEGNVLGFYNGDEVGVKKTVRDVERATLVHELGHVFLLPHTLPADDPGTVMCPYIRPAYYVPTESDVANAILALGC